MSPDLSRLRRDSLTLSLAQLQAIELWNAELAAERTRQSVDLTREMRLDLTRRMQARRREQRALLARTAEQLVASGRLRVSAGAPRAVVAHRNCWLRDGVVARLTESGVEVVGQFEDGADVAGTVVAEQPDLLLVEDRLPTLTGMEVVQRARRFAPDTLVAVHVLDGSAAERATAAGARLVFNRSTSAATMAEELLDCLLLCSA